jgi:hypothetical protein
MQALLKATIDALVNLRIKSSYAIYSKSQGKPIQTHESFLHLYEKVVFQGTQLADGTVADTNQLWLADWYLDNIKDLPT